MFRLVRDGRPVNGFFCSECARKAAPDEDPEAVRLVYVWWDGMPADEGPLQLRLTGVSTETVAPDAADDDDDDDDDDESQPPSEGAPPPSEGSARSLRRFALNAEWSLWVWKQLCDPRRRM